MECVVPLQDIWYVVSRGWGKWILKALAKNLVGVKPWGNSLLVVGEQAPPTSYGPWSFCLGGTEKGLCGHKCVANWLSSMSSHSGLVLVGQTNHRL